jgi:glycosyltransferase involved in cell wall biosynthesis
MKIAIFSDNFYPELSGITDSIILLAKRLAKLGHEICFFVPSYSLRNYQILNLSKKELRLGRKVNIKRFFSLPAPFAGLQSRLVLPEFSGNIFKKFKPDIIHSQLFFGAGLEGLIRAKLNKLPLVGTNHTAISEFVKFVPFNSKIFERISLKYAAWYYNHCDFVTAPSRSVFSEMSQYGFKRPGQVISNPVDTALFHPTSDKAQVKKQFGLGNNTIVYAGRLAPEKNIETVIRAVMLASQKVSDIDLAIAGSGKSESELRQLVDKLGVKNKIKFLGTLSQQELVKLYQASEIFTIASTSETQSLVLMQALACGLPAVVVDARALPEYVNGQNGYVVKADDCRAMADKLILLLENPDLRQKLGQGACNFVQQFSAANIAKVWEKVYERIYERIYERNNATKYADSARTRNCAGGKTG